MKRIRKCLKDAHKTTTGRGLRQAVTPRIICFKKSGKYFPKTYLDRARPVAIIVNLLFSHTFSVVYAALLEVTVLFFYNFDCNRKVKAKENIAARHRYFIPVIPCGTDF